MLSDKQVSEFEASGLIKIDKLVSPDAVSRAREAVLSKFEAINCAVNGEWSLDSHPRSKWPDKGYSAKQIGNKIKEVEVLLDEPPLKPIVNQLLDNAELDRRVFKRPQLLVTLPNDDDWFIPNDGWHLDTPRLSSGVRSGVQIFVLLSDIDSKGGGTLAVSGSHRLLNHGGFIRPRHVVRRLRELPFFEALMGERHASIAQFQDLQHACPSEDHLRLEIVEMSGLAGDAYFMDTRVVHSGAPNAKAQPRMMATHRFVRSEMVIEMMANQ